MYIRWNTRKIALLLFAIMQLTLFIIYWITEDQNTGIESTTHNLKNPVLFISTYDNRTTSVRLRYFTENKKITLRTRSVDELYEDFNTSLCYKKGTDLKVMKRSKNLNWKCMCQSGWHGNDCGQPEVIWRALLASRKRSKAPSLRKQQRRLVYFIELNIITERFTEITFNELYNTVDLFIVCDLSNITNNIERQLRTSLSELTDKILYLKGANRNEIWRKARKTIKNLRDDDIFFINNQYEVPNVKALEFLKLYDKWPELLLFRLKWSVYGFFWRHPNKTVLSSGACTLKYLYEALGNDVDNLKSQSKHSQGFIIGDLNHFGGWFCQFCNEPGAIIKTLQNDAVVVDSKKINTELIEDFIENGIYVDGKTSLQRVYRSRENYYAPNVVVGSNWKYDWLTMNLYSKMDYY